jgi:hypothetical protein
MPLDCLYVGGFRVSFTPLTGVLFTVPSRYSSAIGRCRYLALEGGPPSFRRPSTGAAVLAGHATLGSQASGTGLSPKPVGALSSRLPLACCSVQRGVPVGTPAWSHNPRRASATAHVHAPGLGSSPFARHYLGSVCPFLGVLRCFSSPGSRCLGYRFTQECAPITARGLPHSGISGSMPAHRLPGAFRSAPRPSSAYNAKASTTDVFSLTVSLPYVINLLRLASRPSNPDTSAPYQRGRTPKVPTHQKGQENAPDRAVAALRATSFVYSIYLSRCLWVSLDSNQGPLPYQGSALTT